MRWALIIDGRVTEITEIDPAGRFHPSLVWVECGPEVESGWQYDGEAFSPPEPVVPAPPASITMRQLILGLATDNWITWQEAEDWADRSALPAAVNAVIDQMPEEQRHAARIIAKTMSVAERDNPLLIGAAKLAEPEKTDEEIAEMIADAFTRWSEL